jgi:ACR3 family arsenite efflux pump ArsB
VLAWLVLVAPLLLCGTAAVIGYLVMARHAEQLRTSPVSFELLLATLVMAPLAWILVKVAPEEPDFNNGGACPTVDEGLWGAVFLVLYLGSAVVGGLALAASLVSSPSLKKPAGVLLAALGVPYVIGITVLFAAFCGMN